MANARTAKTAREKAEQLRLETERTAARRRIVVAGIAVLAVLLLAVAGTASFRLLQKQKADREAARVAPPAHLHAGEGKAGPGLLVGNTTAKVTVDVYEDFLCPVCTQFETTDGPLLRKYAADGKIKLVYHPVAILDRASAGTAYSSRAANAFAVVLDTAPTAALAFHDALFENQPQEGGPGLPDDTLLDLAEKAGADKATIRADLTARKYAGWVSSTTEAFTKAFPPGGTPTVVVDGIQTKKLAPAELTRTIDAALSQ